MSATENKPLVSIGMPVYNGENFIRQALNSLLAQDYEDFELIISDNASTDATQQICFEYASKDSRIRYHRNEANLGPNKNFNRVFELSSGKYFMWASHDDVWEPNFVSRCVEVLRRNPSAVLCYPRAKYIGLDGEFIELPLSSFDTRGMDLVSRFHVVIWGAPIFPIYGLIRSKALKRTPLLKGIFGADIIFQTELSLLGEFAHIPAPLFYKRMPYKGEPTSYDSMLEQADAFLNRNYKPVTTKWSALYLYWKMLCGHTQVVNRHVPGYRGKAILIPSVIFCTLVKYRWILKILLDVSKRKQDKDLKYARWRRVPRRLNRRAYRLHRKARRLSRKVHRLSRKAVYRLMVKLRGTRRP